MSALPTEPLLHRETGRVLVLDDDPGIGSLVSRAVQSMGMDCIYESDCAGFLAAIARWQPTHLILDLVMPDMDGIEVLERLAERGCDAALILISGVSRPVLDSARRIARANGLNVVGTLEKPFTRSALRAALGETSLGDGASGQSVVTATMPALAAPVSAEEVRCAIDERQLSLAYQPKVRCSDGSLVGFEALLRWTHPDHGAMSPEPLIHAAEASGQIAEITKRVLEWSLEWLADYESGAPTLSVNVSAHCLREPDTTSGLVALTRRFGIDPARITLELTETAATDDPAAALGVLTRLRLRGFALSIDDFGTGYSSMSQLALLPFTELKIDKSFVMRAGSSQRARLIVQSTVELGRQLDLDVTAEGVETPAALALLRELGCDYAQGYLFARPLDPAAARAWRPSPQRYERHD